MSSTMREFGQELKKKKGALCSFPNQSVCSVKLRVQCRGASHPSEIVVSQLFYFSRSICLIDPIAAQPTPAFYH